MTRQFWTPQIHIVFLSLTLALVGCTSKVSDVESISSTEGLSKPSPSSVESMSRFENEQATCSATNSFRMIITLNNSEPLKCRDMTRRDPTKNVGPTCPGGVSITNFTAPSSWVDCTEVTLCGKTAKTKTPLSSHPSSRMTQVDFSDAPWGCIGDLEWVPADQTSNTAAIKKIPIDFTPPACPICNVTGQPTCEVCGVDTTPPVIKEVLSEIAGCSKIKVLVFAEDTPSGLNRDAYSFDGGLTWQSSNEFIFPVMTLELPAAKIKVRDRAGNIATGTRNISTTSPPCPCDAPWGEKVPHGESRTAFQVGTVTCAGSCDTQSITRTCTNGVLSGSAAYSFNQCKIEGCPDCTMPWGEKIKHGESRAAYENPNVTCADQCRSTTLSCDRGNTVGPASSYPAKACAFTKTSCNCTFEGSIIPNGGSKQVFAAAEVACGSTCTPQTVGCNLGTLTGAVTSKAMSCSPKVCKCTTPWGQKINLNEEVDAFKVAALTCSSGTTCRDAGNMIRIKCANVQTNELTVVQGTGKVSEFGQPSCSSSVCSCVHLGTVLRPTDPPMEVFRFDKSVAPAKCKDPGNVGQVRCVLNGSTYQTQGDINTATFKHTVCEDPPGGGASSENVGAGAGGGSGGGIGNDDGEGEGFKSRFKKTKSKSCDINKPPYFCLATTNNMQITGGGFCFLPTANGYTAPPTDPKDLSQRLERGGFVTAFSRQTVACGDSCARYSATISCLPDGMSHQSTYPYSECTESCP